MNQINIPLPCPSCDGKMYATSYDAPLKILKIEAGKFAENVDLNNQQRSSKGDCGQYDRR